LMKGTGYKVRNSYQLRRPKILGKVTYSLLQSIKFWN